MGVYKDSFKHFALWTSASGLPHVARAPNTCLCVFWIVIFLICAAMFGLQMFFLIQNYLAYNVIVNTQLEFQQLDFPAVTICNLNPFKQSLATAQVSDIQNLMTAYEAAIANQNMGGDAFGLTNTTNDTMAIQANARTQLMFIAAQQQQQMLLSIGYDLNEFILSCTFQGHSCDMSRDFTSYVDATYGVCWQFNNRELTKYVSTRAGPAYGLRLLIQTNLTDYLNITESAGVRVTVSGQGESVFPDAFGYNAAAGFTTSFSLKYVTTQRLGGKYGDCTMIPATQYSTEGCFRQCLQNYIVQTCGCGDPRFTKTSSQSYCDRTKATCVNNAAGVGTSSSGGGFNAQTCNCPQLCSESTYTMTVSSAVWPSQTFMPDNCRKYYNFGFNSPDDCLEWYGENTMMIELYYERMNFEMLSENAAYPFVNLLSDFGGQIGLWIGVSAITMVEFLFIPIFMCVACCRQKNKPSIMDVDHEHEDLLDEEDEDNMYNMLGNKARPKDPPPPYSARDNPMEDPAKMPPPVEETPNGDRLAPSPVVDYNDVKEADMAPPAPHTVP